MRVEESQFKTRSQLLRTFLMDKYSSSIAVKMSEIIKRTQGGAKEKEAKAAELIKLYESGMTEKELLNTLTEMENSITRASTAKQI